MPAFCPHCHKMVADGPTCANCGKSLRGAGPLQPHDADRAAMWLLMRDAVRWILAFVGGILLCLLLLYFFLA